MNHTTRRLQAAESANRLLIEAGVDQTRQIDVFGLCEQLGVWLAFFPLDGLLGAYLPEGSGGVLITTRRPITVQRYTAAHELGHWRLRHDQLPVFNSEEQVLGETQDESEQLAQIFAAALLMPPPLVYGTLNRLTVDNDVTPVHAYTVAREAGVSYTAAVRQITNLGIITRLEADKLLEIKPLKIKTEIGQGQRPAVGTADVWLVDEQYHGQRLRIHTDDEIVISLPENRSTGYRWCFEDHTTMKTPTPEPPHLLHTESSGQLHLIENQSEIADQLRENRRHGKARISRAALDLARAAQPTPSKEPVEIDDRMILAGDRYIAAQTPMISGSDPRRARLTRLSETNNEIGRPSRHPTRDLPKIGGVGRRILNIRFHKPGLTLLRLKHQSAFNANADPIDGYVLDVEVESRRRGVSVEQMLAAHNENKNGNAKQRQSEHNNPDMKWEPQSLASSA